MNCLAMIPARGGSKRIPRKNIRDFLGKPIIAYSIETALRSGLFDEVMVSTDDEEIAEVAKQYGAKVPFLRSEENSNDYATTWAVIQEVLAVYHNKSNRIFDYVCCIYPTAPLIQPNHINKGLYLLREKGFNAVFPIVSFDYPVWRGLETDNAGKTKMIWPEFLNSRSQDLKKIFHDAGQWYWIDLSKKNDSVFTENSGSIILSEEEVQDIDNFTDWQLAEMKYKLLHEA